VHADVVGASIAELLEHLYAAAGAVAGDAPTVTVRGPRHVLPSVFDVTAFAAATTGAAAAAIAELMAARTARGAPGVAVDTRRAAMAFLSEQAFTPIGWDRPPVLDPVTGDYRARDGWIRLHTNYRSHRRAAMGVLGLPEDVPRQQVAAAVAPVAADELEAAVVAAGGAAAAMRTEQAWAAHPHGAATIGEPAVRVEPVAPTERPRWTASRVDRPLSGVRVLDLTRVIAGPVCTRVLAAFGADVLRVDPPGFEEVAAIVPDTTVGKRCTTLDLASGAGRRRFVELLGTADVVVHGLRPGAMEANGFATAALRAANPGIVTARLDAYGWVGPWAGRRGFDSLVQMSAGIAAAGAAAAGTERPTPLPAQALDHGTGYLLAAAIVRALTQRALCGAAADITASLLGAANVVRSMPVPDGLALERPVARPVDTVATDTAWGPAWTVPCPCIVDGHPPRWDLPAGPLGRHPAAFT
jgi:CoA-transferase family III